MRKLLPEVIKILVICLILITAFIITGCSISCMINEDAPLDARIISPNKTYEIQLKEQVIIEDRFMTCYGDHKVTMSVEKNNQQFISEEVIYSGDGMDQRFGETDGFWLAENVLSFYGETKSTGKHSEIKVINQTNKEIKDLNITGGGKFIMFDLMPNEEVILLASSQTHAGKFNSLGWISCFGNFADGGKIYNEGVGFEVGGKNTSTTHYSVIIKDSGVEIGSVDVKKVKSSS